jgi:3-phenylpropionate/cinnamic acid dioxygenase small subunit
MRTLPPVETVTELTQVLYHEASLLDDGLYEDWLELLHEDVRYVAPIREDLSVRDAALRGQAMHELKFFDDDLGSLRLRVAKIRTGLSQTENPPSRVVRLVSNVLISHRDNGEDHPVQSGRWNYWLVTDGTVGGAGRRAGASLVEKFYSPRTCCR